jgi:hypothetical protein
VLPLAHRKVRTQAPVNALSAPQYVALLRQHVAQSLHGFIDLSPRVPLVHGGRAVPFLRRLSG